MKAFWTLIMALFFTTAGGAEPTPTPKDDCEKLMTATLPFAQKMLRQHGEFFPYGGALDKRGAVVAVGATDGREQPHSADIIRLLKDSFVQGAKAGKYRATALIYDVRVTLPSTGQKSDAIAVALDHRDHYSVVVMFPYQFTGGELTIGSPFAQKGEGDIFRPK